MASDPVQFALMMNNRPQASLDKAQKRNDEVFKQTMEAASMAQRAQQMQNQQEQFDITTQLRMKENDLNMKRSMAEAGLAERRFGIAEREIGLREKEAERQMKEQESLQIFSDKLRDIDFNASDAGSKIEGAMQGMSPDARSKAEGLIIAKKNRTLETDIGKLTGIQRAARLERFKKLDSRFMDKVDFNNEDQLREAEVLTAIERQKEERRKNDEEVRVRGEIEKQKYQISGDAKEEQKALAFKNQQLRDRYLSKKAEARNAMSNSKPSLADKLNSEAEEIYGQDQRESPNDSKAPSSNGETVRIKIDGQVGRISKDKLEEALKRGAIVVE